MLENILGSLRSGVGKMLRDEPARGEWEFAEANWESTRQMVSEGDPYGRYVWSVLNQYYPGNKKKQVRVLGFINEIYESGSKSIPEEEAEYLAEKWGVEDLLLKERGFGGISLS